MNLKNPDDKRLNPLQYAQADLSLADGEARFQAIDPGESFIVQAPAGSGKTALLTQRFLALLSQVEQPEQVVAMTFTKKAAAEMRNRILEALQFGEQPLAADASLFDRNSWQLAQAALQNNEQREWQLLDNPNRLRIRTLDSMNGYLVQQMPLLSRLGAQPQLATMQDALYIEAARNALKDSETAEASAELLRLVNGKLRRAEALLVSMLKKRDQWMSSLLKYGAKSLTESVSAREQLQAAVADLVEQEQQQAWKAIAPIADALLAVCDFAEFAESHVTDAGLKSSLQTLIVFRQSGQVLAAESDLTVWRALAHWVQTQAGSWLKTVNKNKGFPPGKGDNKTQKDGFLAELETIRTADFQDKAADALAQLSQLPDAVYADEDWQSLQHLIRLLRHSVSHLKVCFQQAGETDFIEVAQAAALALGEDTAPTDLAQQLDYQIRHLLIDEFQDTSVAQYSLIQKLVTAWTPGDGHTLFIVGDPMQSIYRFREAEVGNFLQAWQAGIADVALTPLHLTVNFRSSAGVVDWVNQTFASVFPTANQLELGAVCYAPANASPDALKTQSRATPAVFTHWQLAATQADEVASVLAVIQQRLAEADFSDTQSIGILGRSRSHLMPIAVALKQAGIAFKAVELEGLKDRQEIQDCQALTRALIHLGDRPAWIALLRSPLVGLSLADLNTLLTEDARPTTGTIWQRLAGFLASSEVTEDPKNDQAWSNLVADISETGRIRLTQTLPVLQKALQSRGSVELSVWLRQTWLALDGPQTVLEHNALQNVDAYWQMLASLASASSTTSALTIAVLDETLEALYAQPDASPQAKRVELMTMHKSKGLEFDTVILPSLGRKPRNDDAPLLSWLSFRSANKEQLVIAPLAQKGKANGKPSPLVELIKRYETQKQHYETARLLYVACTRAKNRLHCFGSVTVSEKVLAGDAELAPVQSSLLSCLWPLVADEFAGLLDCYQAADTETDAVDWLPKISRLPLGRTGFDQSQPENVMQALIPKLAALESPLQAVEVSANPNDAAELARLVGVWIHQVLEQWAINNVLIPSVESLAAQQPRHQFGLMQLGLRGEGLAEGVNRVMTSLQNVLQNQQVRWALSAKHLEPAAELPLSSLEMAPQGQMQQNHIVDRTFVDEAGCRWIVDYKTHYLPSNLQSADAVDMNDFIDVQIENYRPQLQRYGRLFYALENRPQKWVLYFTHLDRWVEVPESAPATTG